MSYLRIGSKTFSLKSVIRYPLLSPVVVDVNHSPPRTIFVAVLLWSAYTKIASQSRLMTTFMPILGLINSRGLQKAVRRYLAEEQLGSREA